MKTPFALFMSLWLVASCSWLNPLHSKKTEETSAGFKPNEFLWQAAKEKLSFMTVVLENEQNGVLIADWNQFKVEVNVLSPLLRADALTVSAYTRINGEEKPAERLDGKLENAILNRARVLYRESLAIK